MDANIDEALAFLRKWPAAFPHLVAIHVDPVTHEKVSPKDGGIEGRSFSRDDLDDDGPVAKWLAERTGKANLYFTVNSLKAPMTGKPGKKDIGTVVALHVDVDVPAQGDQEAGATAIATAIADWQHEPSALVLSGGGAQGFWVLSPTDAIAIDGDVAKAQEAERYTRWLEAEFAKVSGGKTDACHNVDRIMRIPGTVNVPDAKKIAKGRKPALARLERFTDLRYPLGAFQQAPSKTDMQRFASTRPRDEDPRGGGASDKPEEPLTTLDDPRLHNVPKDVLEAIESGRHTDHTDAGGLHFHLVCQMVRAGCSAFVIKAAYRLGKVSEGAGTWPRGFDGEMDRVIQRARDATVDKDLERLNQRHAVINIGGKTKVLTWQPSFMYPGQDEAQISSFEDFAKLLNNRSKETQVPTANGSKTISVPLGDWWLKNKWRRQYNNGFKFMPACEAVEVNETLNLWRGFGVAPFGAPEKCKLFLAHCLEVLCNGVQEYYAYLLRWMAFIVQFRTRTEVAVLLRSDEEGNGKGMFGRYFGTLFASHYMQVTQPNQVIGQFNPHLEKLLLLHADEALFAGDPRHRNALWSLITEPTIAIEPKGVDIYKAPNFLNLIITTNARHAVQVDSTARRIFALDVPPTKRGDHEYFVALVAEMEGEGPSALLAYLQSLDLTGFNVRNIPKTDALEEQKSLSRHGIDAVIEELCHTGMLPCQHRHKENCTSTYGERNNEGFWAWCKANFPDLRRDSPHILARQLKAAYGIIMWPSGVNYLRFPDLQDLRERFDSKHGPQDYKDCPIDWLKEGQRPASGGQNERSGDKDGVPF